MIGLICKPDVLEYAVDWQNLNYRALPFYDLVPTGNFWLAKKWYARCLLMIIFGPEEQFGRSPSQLENVNNAHIKRLSDLAVAKNSPKVVLFNYDHLLRIKQTVILT